MRRNGQKKSDTLLAALSKMMQRSFPQKTPMTAIVNRNS